LKELEQDKFSKFIEQFEKHVENIDDCEAEKREKKWMVPYFYRTPDNLLIDLRLYDKGKNFKKKLKFSVFLQKHELKKYFVLQTCYSN
jgi:hypothetical protein